MTTEEKIYYFSDFLREKADLTQKNWTEMTLLAKSFRDQKSIVFIDFFQALLSLLTLIFLYLLFKCKELRRVYSLIDLDLKFIVLLASFYYTLGSINSFVVYGYKFIIFMLDLDPSFYIWSGSTCFYSHIIFAAIEVQAVMLIHFCMFLERLVAAFVKPTFRFYCNGIFGFILVSTIFFGTITSQLFIVIRKANFLNSRVYCGSSFTDIMPNVSKTIIIMSLLDLFVSLLDFLLYLINKSQIKRYKTKLNTFNLQRSFNLKSLQISIEIIYPYSMVHSVCYTLQCITYLIYANNAESLRLEQGFFLYECAQTSRIFSNLAVISFLYFHTRRPKIRSNNISTSTNNADTYFQEFNKMIS